MTIRITKDRLMEEISAIRDAFILEAEYSEEELKRLNVPTGSAPAAVKTAVKEETEPLELLMEQPGHEAEAKPEAAAKHKTATIVSISLGVVLAAAAIVLFMLFWNPKHSQVASTTEAEMDATQEASEAPTEAETEQIKTQEATEAATQEPIVAVSEVKIDEEHFPDLKFRKYIIRYFDTNKDNALDDLEIQNAKEIVFDALEDVNDRSKVASLKGIEYFTQLELLRCADNQLSELDIAKNTALRVLDCSGNRIAALDLSHNTALEELDCRQNDIREIDVSSNTGLNILRCDGNPWESLNVGSLPEKESFFCDVETWHLVK